MEERSDRLLHGWMRRRKQAGRGRKSREETPPEGVWQGSDGGMGRGTLNLLEEEVWRKGLEKTGKRGETWSMSLTWPPSFCAPPPPTSSQPAPPSWSALTPLESRSVWESSDRCDDAAGTSISSVLQPLTPRGNRHSSSPSEQASTQWPTHGVPTAPELTIRCEVEAGRDLLRPEVLSAESVTANLHLRPESRD